MSSIPIEYSAEMDAHTLAEAEVIRADSTRLGAATLAAAQLKKNAEVTAKAFDNVVGHIYDHKTSIQAREERKKHASSAS